MNFEQPPEASQETPSDKVRRMIQEQNIKVGPKENKEDSFATLVTLKATSINRPDGLQGRILEVNYDDAEPYLVITVHGYKVHKKILLKDVIDINVLE